MGLRRYTPANAPPETPALPTHTLTPLTDPEPTPNRPLTPSLGTHPSMRILTSSRGGYPTLTPPCPHPNPTPTPPSARPYARPYPPPPPYPPLRAYCSVDFVTAKAFKPLGEVAPIASACIGKQALLQVKKKKGPRDETLNTRAVCVHTTLSRARFLFFLSY